jgi:hypothetical protein
MKGVPPMSTEELKAKITRAKVGQNHVDKEI